MCGLLQTPTLMIVACEEGSCEDVGNARRHVVCVLMYCGVEVELVSSVTPGIFEHMFQWNICPLQ